jgi:hypothetical protein
MKEIIDNLQGYIQSNIDLAKLEVQEKIDLTVQKITKIGSLLLLALLSIIFFLAFLAILIGSLSGSYTLGFGIITFLLITATTLLYFWSQKNNLKQP